MIRGKAKNYGGMLMNTPPQVWGKRFDLEVETKPDRCAHAGIVLVINDAVITRLLELIILCAREVAKLDLQIGLLPSNFDTLPTNEIQPKTWTLNNVWLRRRPIDTPTGDAITGIGDQER